MTTSTARPVPAEETQDGFGLQRVHVCDPETGKPLRRLTYPGTVDQARAAARLQTMHDTHPDYLATLAILRGE
ncbi:hypothetical protein [Streptosporangium vulgare]|uniref:Uncharacterized protein n=1 Tax=Streptosporangium vulgare TaxID=46190 RepID=A0ABV5TUK0_9ACTN